MDKLEKKIKNTINKQKLLKNNEKFILGVSGGPDSVALLHILYNLGFRPIIVHVNYQLRGKDSDLDEQFVKGLAKSLKLPIYSKRVDIRKHRGNLEENARNIRYYFFQTIVQKKLSSKNSKILVAHNADDQIETVLMNMLRGAGGRGLSGMNYQNNQIIRPMLDIWRLEIEDYLDKNKYEYRIDQSNFDLKFKRNQIRHQLIPKLEKENKNFKIMFLRKIKDNQKKYEKILVQAKKNYQIIKIKEEDEQITLDLDKWRKLNKNLQTGSLRLIIEKIKGNLLEVAEIHLKEISDLLKSPKSGVKKIIPGNIVIYKDYTTFEITDKLKINKLEKKAVKVPGVTNVSSGKIKAEIVKKIGKNDGFTVFLDYDKIRNAIQIRRRKAGDNFYPSGMTGKKKLQDFFVDMKVPQRERDGVPIIFSGKDILWIAGFRADRRFLANKDTNKILKLTYKGLIK